MSSSSNTAREVSGALLRPIVGYVARTLGADGELALAVATGLDLAAMVADPGCWLSNEEFLAVVGAAAELCGDPDIGRRAGEELFYTGCEAGIGDHIITLGGVAEAIGAITAYSTRMSVGRTLVLADVGEGRATIEGSFSDPALAESVYCALTSGYYAMLPSLFAAVGRVVERTCQARGDDVCRFDVTWSPDPRPRVVQTDAERAALVEKNEHGLVWFEALQKMASELVRAKDVEEVLARICERASLTLNAPRFLLAVETHGRRRVHHVGFVDPSDADVAAAVLLDSGFGESDGVLVADVISSRHAYGKLAALFVPGVDFAEYEHRLLEAYAGHAAAALDVVSSLEDARRERDAARGLLDLAGALANLTDGAEIAARLADSVPVVIRSDVATVWRWNARSEELDCIAWHETGLVDSTTAIAAAGSVAAAGIPELAELVRSPRPVLLRLEDAPAPIRRLLEQHGVQSVAIAPITTSARFYGVVAAGFHAVMDEVDVPETRERLGGLAQHAAAAMDNSRLLAEIRHQALHDPLTGLPNRRLIQERAATVLAETDGEHASAALLFVDLDRFKNVNDTLGHGAGDVLINQVADRIQGALHPAQMLGRLGGDEFLVILPALRHPHDAEVAAAAIVEALDAPFELEGEELFVSCSVGIACFPANGSDLASLMRHADSAMYTAKARGRRTFSVDPTGPEPHRRQQLALETGLHKATANDEFFVAYQPQVDLSTGRVIGVEALVRWNHPTLGVLLPGAFLPLAEESGIVVEMDRHVRRLAFAQGATWAAAGTPVSIAVNLSTRDLLDPDLVAELAAMMSDAGLDPTLVELEVTDLVVMDEDVLAPVLHRLKALGVRLAIDDFGTGTSVLGRLHHCPLDSMKIDKSFVDAIATSGTEVPLVRALIALAHSLELTVVAEGVERVEQLDVLQRYGCDVGQGYWFGRPMPADDVGRLLGRTIVLAGVDAAS